MCPPSSWGSGTEDGGGSWWRRAAAVGSLCSAVWGCLAGAFPAQLHLLPCTSWAWSRVGLLRCLHSCFWTSWYLMGHVVSLSPPQSPLWYCIEDFAWWKSLFVGSWVSFLTPCFWSADLILHLPPFFFSFFFGERETFWFLCYGMIHSEPPHAISSPPRSLAA